MPQPRLGRRASDAWTILDSGSCTVGELASLALRPRNLGAATKNLRRRLARRGVNACGRIPLEELYRLAGDLPEVVALQREELERENAALNARGDAIAGALRADVDAELSDTELGRLLRARLRK